MNRYRICKIQDGNGNITYQIKEKKWLFWRWVYVGTGPLGHYEPLDFLSFEKAKDWVKECKKVSQYFQNSRKTKIVECVEV